MHKTVGNGHRLKIMIHIAGHRFSIIPENGFNDTENYFTVNCCGYEKYMSKNVKTLRESGRFDYQLLYMTKGIGCFKIDGKMTNVPSGNIVIFHPEETQEYAYQCKDTPELYWAHFTGYGAHDLMNKVGLSPGRLHYAGVHNICIEYFKKIILELQLKAPLYQQAADAALMELLAVIGRKAMDMENPRTSIIDADILNIMEQMHSEYNGTWNIAKLAKQCKLSPNRFMHKFKIQTGLSAMEYLMKIRMDKAKDLLLNSSLSIKEISNVIGYENPLYFSRLFSKTEGVSPREYRNHQYPIYRTL